MFHPACPSRAVVELSPTGGSAHRGRQGESIRVHAQSAGRETDLSGSWESEPGYFQNLAKDLKPDDVVMQPWAKALQAEREGKEHQDDPLSDCMLPGVPRISLSTETMVHPFKIVQTPGARCPAL